ncbi:MAG: hypothetical protein ABFC63_03375 [Thermoguttaceae bacterium]
MTQRRLGWAVLAAGVVLSLVQVAGAQMPGDPANRPTLSPWFGLYQKNGGPLDNYHMFVRPRLQLNNTLRQQQDAIGRNDAGIHTLDQEMTRYQEQAGVRPTGSSSVFMYYSHYYPRGQAVSGWASPAASAASGQRHWLAPRSSSLGHGIPTTGR